MRNRRSRAMRDMPDSSASGASEAGRRRKPAWPHSERGMALLTVLVFAFVFLIGVTAFFAIAGYEAGQAQMRQDSARAFYLADGAIEQAKGELVMNGRWTAGYAKTSVDGGL